MRFNRALPGAALTVWLAAGPAGICQQGQPGTVVPDEPAAVMGTAVDSVTGVPLPKARVSMSRTGRGDRRTYSATTGASGQFTFRDVEPGNYHLSAQKNRYATAVYGEKRPGDGGTTLSAGAGEALDGLLLKLSPAAVVTGRVIDEDGEPVAYAQVMALKYRYRQGRRELAPSGGSASTNDLGEYRMFGIPAGEYYIAAATQRFGPRRRMAAPAETDRTRPTLYYPGMIDPSQAAPVRLQPGQEQPGVDFRLMSVAAGSVSGMVAMADGTVLPRGASVFLLPKNRPYAVGGARRGASLNRETGEFEIAGVLPGSYDLFAFSRGRDRLFGRQSVEVGEDSVDGIVVPLRPGLTQSGLIEFEGEPPPDFDIGGVRVRMTGANVLWGGGSSQTGEDGTFAVDTLAPGMYRITLSGLPASAYLKAATAGDRDVLSGGLDLNYGAAADLKLTVSLKGGSISGLLTDEDGNPSQASTVLLIPEESKRQRQDLFRRLAADQYGRFSAEGLAPGKYELFAFEYIEPGAHYDPAFLEPLENAAEKVTIEEGSREAVDLEVIPAAAEGA